MNALDQYGRTLEARALTGDGLTIGGAPDNDLILDAPAIEPRHLLVDWDGQVALVTNLSGGNNVVIGDTTLLADATRSWNWDEPIRLGPFWLRLEATLPDNSLEPTVAGVQLQFDHLGDGAGHTSGGNGQRPADCIDRAGRRARIRSG